ncbi:MAG: hypothetical protein ACLP1X_11900 [Polyangiaceae bacterium]
MVFSVGVCADANGQASSPAADAPRTAPAMPPGTADVVFRRDGTSVAGIILRQDIGKGIVVLGANGTITIPWEDVDHVVSSASPPRAPTDTSTPTYESTGKGSPATSERGADFRAASKRIAGVWLGGDAWADANVLLKHYTVTDGSSAWSSGADVGAMAFVSLHFRGPPVVDEDGETNWIECELGIGAGAHDGFWRAYGRGSVGFVDGETPLVVGLHYAVGHLHPARDDVSWSGALLGLAWVPTYVNYFGEGGAPSRGALNPAGIRLTIDVGRFSIGHGTPTPMLRLVLGWLPDVGPLPTTFDAGVGCAFY